LTTAVPCPDDSKKEVIPVDYCYFPLWKMKKIKKIFVFFVDKYDET